jgi:hypothetical protein
LVGGSRSWLILTRAMMVYKICTQSVHDLYKTCKILYKTCTRSIQDLYKACTRFVQNLFKTCTKSVQDLTLYSWAWIGSNSVGSTWPHRGWLVGYGVMVVVVWNRSSSICMYSPRQITDTLYDVWKWAAALQHYKGPSLSQYSV